MFAESGTGSNVGVSYSYKILKEEWFASYECRVHRYLIENNKLEFETKPFEVHGHQWGIRMKHHGSGHLGMSLHSLGERCASVHFGMTLVNFDDETKSEYSGGRVVFSETARRWGREDLVAVSTMENPASGFWRGDSFVVRTDIRIIQPENESQMISVEGNTLTCTWRLKNVKGRCPFKLESKEFALRDTKWMLFAGLYDPKTPSDLSFHVYNGNEQNLRIRFELEALHINSTSNRSKSFTETIHPKRASGWKRFLSGEEVANASLGFLDDDWITFVAVTTLVRDDANPNPFPERTPECVICRISPQVAGVLHGNTVHKCFCLDCAKAFAQQSRDLKCPLCRKDVERVIERFY